MFMNLLEVNLRPKGLIQMHLNIPGLNLIIFHSESLGTLVNHPPVFGRKLNISKV